MKRPVFCLRKTLYPKPLNFLFSKNNFIISPQWEQSVSVIIKVILIKVFVKRGAGKRNFIHKGFFPAKQFCNSPLNSFVSRLINFYNQSQKQTFLLSDCQNNRNFTDVIL